jgi:DNA-binding response OmpR family regulator
MKDHRLFGLLAHAPILIVEDEPFIALELQASIEDAGGEVLGPVGSVSAAMELLKTARVAAAILDVQLSDGDVTPVAEALLARGVPIVFQSGVNLPPELQRRCPDVIFYKKPASASLLLAKIAELIRRQAASGPAAPS